jgi:acyl carrier protein
VQYDKTAISLWIREYIGKLLSIPVDDVQTDVEFASYGLTSSTAVALLADLEETLNRELSPALLFEHPTIDAIALHLESEVRRAAPGTARGT